jgi:hypothetical protein
MSDTGRGKSLATKHMWVDKLGVLYMSSFMGLVELSKPDRKTPMDSGKGFSFL